jgi:preprotein translocase subunit Sec63
LCLIGLIIFLLRYNPKIISILPLIFVLFFKWLPILKILKSIFLKTNYSDNFNNMSRKEAYDILGLKPDATKNDIIKRYNLLIKKNHPDVEGSEWISKKLNKARDILLG